MATLHLSDFGADVIAIDDGRREPMPAGLLRLLNRGKRSLGLDVRTPAGRAVFLRLARTAGVVVEGFRPGVADSLGVGFEAVRAMNPRIVYCSISGYGQTGPERMRAGHDINYLAESGVGSEIGTAGSPPALPNIQIGDLLGGALTAAMGILAALFDVERGAPGRHIDVSMTGSLLAHAVVARAGLSETGRPAARGEDLLSGALPCYGYYRTADGRYLAVGALESKFWDRLCEALGRPDLKPEQFSSAVRRELEAVFAAHDSRYWDGFFREVDCCVSVVLRIDEAVAKWRPQGPALAMDGMEASEQQSAPPAGAHTRRILAEAGYSAAEIEALAAAGAIISGAYGMP
jgi:alpha-methylacyl-CoA racemase